MSGAPAWGSDDHLRLELRHLERGATESDGHVGLGPIRLHFAAPDPALVIDRARELLRVTNTALLRGWEPDSDEAPEEIPEWFERACAPEGRSTGERWSVRGWLWWAHPNRRLWFWWDARVVRPGVGVAEIAPEGAPFPSEALRWLLKASGATEVDYL